jgi:hypothetical protein
VADQSSIILQERSEIGKNVPQSAHFSQFWQLRVRLRLTSKNAICLLLGYGVFIEHHKSEKLIDIHSLVCLIDLIVMTSVKWLIRYRFQMELRWFFRIHSVHPILDW